jgi:hypothetical protein
MHWRSVEFGLIFDDESADQFIEDYQKSLTLLDSYVRLGMTESELNEAGQRLEKCALSAAQLVLFLAKKADVSSR